ncbi:MAG TPA: YegS/Rv2252/BmrU family lipid kinase [Flavisolibacter sp.]|nr:YegS/Rv2252/BmrU family lipid kinase [Flavisolibacter sp.]
MKVLFIINPVSGGKEKRDWEEQIRAYFNASPHTMEFFLLTGKSDEASVRHHLDSVRPDRIVAVGGDGTVKMVAEIIQDKSIPLGIIPAGSANGMARELSIPLDVNEALEVAVNGREQTIDVIRINNKEICLHLSDLGLNAMLVKEFEKSKKRGMWGYGRAIFKVLWEKRKMHVTIHTDEETHRRKAYMVVLANARKYGTGANINPEGDVSDGYFEIVVVRKIHLIEIYKSILTNRSFHPNRIEVFQTKKASLSTLKRTHFQVDGEYRGKITQLTAEIVPARLTIMLPVEA